MLQELFKFFSQEARKKSENSLIFIDPEGITTVSDAATIRNYNMELSSNPNLTIPLSSNLQKVQEREIVPIYSIKKNLIIGVKDAFLISYQILNDILLQTFK
jgi:hypothetical protein